MPTALHRNSKADTALLLDAGLADIFVDHGQERTNLAEVGSFIEENPSPRAAIGAPRNITVKVNMQSSYKGVLVYFGDIVGNYSYQITLGGGVVSVAEAGLLRASVTVPDLTGSDRLVLVHWSQRVEGSNVIDEVAVCNLVTNAWVFARAAHAAATPNPTHILSVGVEADGSAGPYSGGIGAFHVVHIGRRFHSTTEAKEDWVAEATPPTIVGLRRAPLLTGASDDLLIASEGQFAGPSFLMAGAATRQAAHRQVGPFVGIRYNSPNSEYSYNNPARWYRITPDAQAGWYWCIRYLAHGELSMQVNYAHVRAHITVNTGEEECSPVSFRAFSFAHLPTGALNEPKMIWYKSEIETISTPSDSGVWLDFNVRLAREPNGISYVTLGFKMTPTEDEGDLYDTAWQLNALTVDPYSRDISNGGFGGDIDGFAN